MASMKSRLGDLERRRARASPRSPTPEEEASREAGFAALFADLDSANRARGFEPPARDETEPAGSVEELRALFVGLDEERKRLIQEGFTE